MLVTLVSVLTIVTPCPNTVGMQAHPTTASSIVLQRLLRFSGLCQAISREHSFSPQHHGNH